MKHPEDPHLSFFKNILKNEAADSHEPIAASELSGDMIKNLQLLHSLIQSERVKTDIFKTTSDSSSTQALKKIVIDDLASFSMDALSKVKIPKRFHDVCFELLVTAWQKKMHSKTPTTLTIKTTPFNLVSFKAFVIALALNVTLSALRLEDCKLASDEMGLISVFIKVHPTLTYLYLDQNPIGDGGLRPIFASLKDNTQLLHLSLNNTQLTDKSHHGLIEVLQSCRLQYLNLENNSFSSKALEALQQAASKAQCSIHC